MHDDHSLRAQWVLSPTSSAAPMIDLYAFPCNQPATGCNDSAFDTPTSSCDCVMPVASDAPQDSCKNCVRWY
jgi:hypothetical protein